jgi:predicted membrane channel-forming protein YqfA (hemolysin III family)
MLHETSFQIINMYSIGGTSTVTLATYSRGGVHQMWILKKSKDMLEYIQFMSLYSCNSIKTFDFSTLYTTIPHSKLKDKLRELVHLCFIKK